MLGSHFVLTYQVAQVVTHYKQLPPIGNQGFLNSSPQFQKYKAWLQFVNQLIKKTRNVDCSAIRRDNIRQLRSKLFKS